MIAQARMDSAAMEALTLMVDKHFRHLPVLRGGGGHAGERLAGVLDIAKCLNDAVSRLERSMGSAEDEAASAEVVQQVSHRHVIATSSPRHRHVMPHH